MSPALRINLSRRPRVHTDFALPWGMPRLTRVADGVGEPPFSRGPIARTFPDRHSELARNPCAKRATA